MSPSGGLRGRRGSILGTAVQLGRRGYDSVHFLYMYIQHVHVEIKALIKKYFFLELDAHIRSEGRAHGARTDCNKRVLCESKKKHVCTDIHVMSQKNGSK